MSVVGGRAASPAALSEGLEVAHCCRWAVSPETRRTARYGPGRCAYRACRPDQRATRAAAKLGFWGYLGFFLIYARTVSDSSIGWVGVNPRNPQKPTLAVECASRWLAQSADGCAQPSCCRGWMLRIDSAPTRPRSALYSICRAPLCVTGSPAAIGKGPANTTMIRILAAVRERDVDGGSLMPQPTPEMPSARAPTKREREAAERARQRIQDRALPLAYELDASGEGRMSLGAPHADEAGQHLRLIDTFGTASDAFASHPPPPGCLRHPRSGRSPRQG